VGSVADVAAKPKPRGTVESRPATSRTEGNGIDASAGIAGTAHPTVMIDVFGTVRTGKRDGWVCQVADSDTRFVGASANWEFDQITRHIGAFPLRITGWRGSRPRRLVGFRVPQGSRRFGETSW
jgi:hypothetical protein